MNHEFKVITVICITLLMFTGIIFLGANGCQSSCMDACSSIQESDAKLKCIQYCKNK